MKNGENLGIDLVIGRPPLDRGPGRGRGGPGPRGGWTSVGSVVRLGSSDHFPEMSSENLTYGDETKYTLVIEEQNGRRFAGERFLTENPEISEAILGVIGFDYETVYMVDEDGQFDGRLISETEMELVYREVDPDGMIVAISRYTKT